MGAYIQLYQYKIATVYTNDYMFLNQFFGRYGHIPSPLYPCGIRCTCVIPFSRAASYSFYILGKTKKTMLSIKKEASTQDGFKFKCCANTYMQQDAASLSAGVCDASVWSGCRTPIGYRPEYLEDKNKTEDTYMFDDKQRTTHVAGTIKNK